MTQATAVQNEKSKSTSTTHVAPRGDERRVSLAWDGKILDGGILGLGQGVDRLGKTPKQQLAAAAPTKDAGSSSRLLLHAVASFEQLSGLVGLTVETSVSDFFGLDLESRTAISGAWRSEQFDVWVLVSAGAKRATALAPPYSLAEGVALPETADSLASFLRTYGDAFVSTLWAGGEAMALFRLHAESHEEQLEIQTHLMGSPGDSALHARFERLVTTWRRSVDVQFRRAGGVQTVDAMSPAAVIQYLTRDFNADIAAAPGPVAYQLTGGDVLGGFLADSLFAQATARREQVVKTTEVLSGVHAELLRIQARRADFHLAPDPLATPDPNPTEELLELIEELGWLREEVERARERITGEPQKAYGVAHDVIERATALAEGPLPSLTVQIARTVGGGGDGGNRFYDDDVAARANRLVSVSVNAGAKVDRISRTWDAAGEPSATHGDSGGRPHTLYLDEDERITVVEARSGRVMDQIGLRLRSMDGTRTRQFGPFGGNGGNPFSVEVPRDTESDIIGFFGQAGDLVDNLGCLVRTFKTTLPKPNAVEAMAPLVTLWRLRARVRSLQAASARAKSARRRCGEPSTVETPAGIGHFETLDDELEDLSHLLGRLSQEAHDDREAIARAGWLDAISRRINELYADPARTVVRMDPREISGGGGGGDAFDDAPELSIESSLLGVSIHAGNRVDSIGRRWNTPRGAQKATSGGAGGDPHEIALRNTEADAERITGVMVRAGNVVDRVELEVAERVVGSPHLYARRRVGPFGGGGGDDRAPVFVDPAAGQSIVGFYGRSGNVVDRLHVVVRTVKTDLPGASSDNGAIEALASYAEIVRRVMFGIHQIETFRQERLPVDPGRRQVIDALKAEMGHWMSKIGDLRARARTAPELSSPELDTMRSRFTTLAASPVGLRFERKHEILGGGGGGGQAFSDEWWSHPFARLREVRVRAGNRIDAIQRSWHDASSSGRAGGGGGSEYVVSLPEGARLYSVEAKGSGNRVHRLQFTVRRDGGNTPLGWWGRNDDGTYRKVTAENGRTIVGFYGRAGNSLDELGCIVQVVTVLLPPL